MSIPYFVFPFIFWQAGCLHLLAIVCSQSLYRYTWGSVGEEHSRSQSGSTRGRCAGMDLAWAGRVPGLVLGRLVTSVCWWSEHRLLGLKQTVCHLAHCMLAVWSLANYFVEFLFLCLCRRVATQASWGCCGTWWIRYMEQPADWHMRGVCSPIISVPGMPFSWSLGKMFVFSESQLLLLKHRG